MPRGLPLAPEGRVQELSGEDEQPLAAAYHDGARALLPGRPRQDTLVESAFHDNHGTAPDATDANGTPILVETKRREVHGARCDLDALLAQYRSCECDPATTFLSLDSAPGALMEKVLGQVGAYMQANLTCGGGVTTTDIVNALAQKDWAAAIQDLSSCSWNNGASMADSLAGAAKEVLANAGSDVADYHVCNNDAMLQAGLFEQFASSGSTAACDKTSSICHGPSFFYSP